MKEFKVGDICYFLKHEQNHAHVLGMRITYVSDSYYSGSGIDTFGYYIVLKNQVFETKEEAEKHIDD